MIFGKQIVNVWNMSFIKPHTIKNHYRSFKGLGILVNCYAGVYFYQSCSPFIFLAKFRLYINTGKNVQNM